MVILKKEMAVIWEDSRWACTPDELADLLGAL
jgi:hypothetical protein